MAKLYFKYGAMGSSKTAQALITKFNYEERGMKVWLIKPAIDVRDGKDTIKSRVGLSEECTPIDKSNRVFDTFTNERIEADVIIADECQFFTAEQIDDLRKIVDEYEVIVDEYNTKLLLNVDKHASGFFVMARRRPAGLLAASQGTSTQPWRKRRRRIVYI